MTTVGKLETIVGSVIIEPIKNPNEVPANDKNNIIKYIVKNCSGELPKPIIQ